MKNLVRSRTYAGFVYGKAQNLIILLMLLTPVSFMISCQKDITGNSEELNPFQTTTNKTEEIMAAAAPINTYYISPSGNDNNSGTIASPWFSLHRAWQTLQPGDLVYLRGGTYAYTSQLQGYCTGKNGTASDPIRVWGYPGEVPVITKGPGYTNNQQHWRGGVFFSGDYFHWRDIVFTGFIHGSDPISPFIWRGLYIENANFNVFEKLISHDNEYGFNIQANSKGNLLLNCDAFNNWDIGTSGGNADGFGWGYITVNDPSNPNVARGCRSWWNGDDGFDGWHGNEVGGIVKLDSCWSWYNGYYKGTFNLAGNGEGFKMGGGDGGSPGVMMRYYTNCIAFHNKNKGYEQNNLKGNGTFYNCVAVDNNNHGFNIDNNNSAHIIRNCISINNSGTSYMFSSAVTRSHNSGSGSGDWDNNAAAADFTDLNFSTAHSKLSSARKADGSLPTITFLQLAAGSDLIDAGTNVGTAYSGNAPDRGVFEYGNTVPPPPSNQAPTANAGSDITITLPINTVTLSGSGTDPDGTIVAYSWTKISGPTTYTISSASQAQTTINNLVQGTYVFQLTVTDNSGATGSDQVTVTVNNIITPPPTTGIPLNISQVSPDAGYAYYLAQDFGIPGDDGSNPTRSTLRIFENGIEMIPPHTAHADIRSQGKGRFSHWSNGAFAALWFSTSDNTDPRTNGRTYTYLVSSTPVNQPPVANAGPDVTITIPVNSVTLSGSGTDPDGTIVAYAWTKISGPSTYTVSSSSQAQTVVSNLISGTYEFQLTVTDNAGATGADRVTVIVNPATPSSNNTPYGGTPWLIPGIIQAEDFDNGGQNIAYFDNTSGNSGNAYRTNESVDIAVSKRESSPYVGWTQANEWLKYTVNITTSRAYTIQLRVASASTGKSVRLEIDGVTVATIPVPGTGGNQKWTTVTVPNINLSAGIRVLRLYNITGGQNINYIEFQ